jgi:hypothetical protein
VARIKATGTKVALDEGSEIVAIYTPVDDFIINDLGFVSKEATRWTILA